MTIFNLSLQQGSFPEQLKIARVTSIFKTDDVKELENYYLEKLSLLQCLKILEKSKKHSPWMFFIVFNRLLK